MISVNGYISDFLAIVAGFLDYLCVALYPNFFVIRFFIQFLFLIIPKI